MSFGTPLYGGRKKKLIKVFCGFYFSTRKFFCVFFWPLHRTQQRWARFLSHGVSSKHPSVFQKNSLQRIYLIARPTRLIHLTTVCTLNVHMYLVRFFSFFLFLCYRSSEENKRPRLWRCVQRKRGKWGTLSPHKRKKGTESETASNQNSKREDAAHTHTRTHAWTHTQSEHPQAGFLNSRLEVCRAPVVDSLLFVSFLSNAPLSKPIFRRKRGRTNRAGAQRRG